MYGRYYLARAYDGTQVTIGCDTIQVIDSLGLITTTFIDVGADTSTVTYKDEYKGFTCEKVGPFFHAFGSAKAVRRSAPLEGPYCDIDDLPFFRGETRESRDSDNCFLDLEDAHKADAGE